MSLNLAVATVPGGLEAASASAAAVVVAAAQGTTRPHTIRQAVEEATRRRKSSSSLSSPIDLVAVVLNIQQHNVDASSSKTPMCRIWIRDASLPVNGTGSAASCQVLIFGRSKEREIAHQLHVKRGDVMRFNRVHLQPEEPHRMNGPNGVSLYTFKHSYQDPEAGLEYIRLLHIDPDDPDTDIQALVKQQEGNEIPVSMRTNPDYLKHLVHWYRTSFSGSWSASTTGHALPQLPTQYRSLAELQFCQGVVSHVVAVVLHVETKQQQPHIGKPRRLSSTGAAHTALPSATTYATLTEGNVGNPRAQTDSPSTGHGASSDSQSGNSIMTLLIHHNDCFQHESFRQILLEACDLKRPLRLSHVVSKKSGQNHFSSVSVASRARLQQDSGMILQPTDLTKMTLLPEANQNEIQSLLANPCDEHIATQASLCLSPSNEQHKDRVLVIMSPVVDIHNAKGISLQSLLINCNCLKNDPSPLINFVRSDIYVDQSPSSLAATVLLQRQDRGDGNINETGSDKFVSIQARMDGPLIQSLCTGGLNPQELLQSPDQARLAVDFVASLVLEQIPLRWTLAVTSTTKTGDDDNAIESPNFEPTHNGSSHPPAIYRVIRVSLPRL